MSKTPRKQKRYQDLSLDELRAVTKEFDREHIEGKPLTPEMKARNARAVKAIKAERRKGERPMIEQGATSVLISIERGLLARADKRAKTAGMTRSQLVAHGLRLALRHGGEEPRRADRRRTA